MMKTICKFLREIFTPQMVWVDENKQGHWVQKKRMHPMLRAFIGSGTALIVIILAANYFWGGTQKKTDSSSMEAAPAALPLSQPSSTAFLSVEDPKQAPASEKLTGLSDAGKSTASPEPGSLAGLQEATVPHPGITAGQKQPDPADTPPDTDATEPATSRKPGSLAIVPDEVRTTLEIDLKPKKGQPAPEIGPSSKRRQPTPAADKPEAEEKLPAPPGRRKDYWIHIDKGNYTLSLYRGQDVVKTYSIAVGKNPGDKQEIGDHRTPVGNFRVVSIENASKWKHDFGDGKGKIAGAYGPWFIRLDAGGWKGIGIHGTHDPDSRGTMATEGCIRLSNEEIQDLKRYAYRNMRVIIEE